MPHTSRTTSSCETPLGQPASMPSPAHLAEWLAALPPDATLSVVMRRTGGQFDEYNGQFDDYDAPVGLAATWERPL